MGCDIHLFVERRNPNTGKWEFVDPQGAAPQTEFDKKNGYWDWYGGRNYNLFAILANVRNGHGTAGCDTGDGFRPISMPRGKPEGASLEYMEKVEQYGVDGHSHSHHTLKDLLDYDWEQTTTCRGVLTALDFLQMQFSEDGRPSSYSGGVSGRSVVMLQPEEMEKYIKTTYFIEGLRREARRWASLINDPKRADYREHDMDRAAQLSATLEVAEIAHTPALDKDFRSDKSYHIKMGWRETYAESAGYFLGTVIPALQELAENPEDIRIVFFFDC
jgi:hypothetical protein